MERDAVDIVGTKHCSNSRTFSGNQCVGDELFLMRIKFLFYLSANE